MFSSFFLCGTYVTMGIYFAEEAGSGCALRRAQITTVSAAVTSKACPLTFSDSQTRVGFGGKNRKREIIQIEAFLGAMLKGNRDCWIVEPFTLCVCVLIGFPFWKPIFGFYPPRHPLLQEVNLVLMLSNRWQNGAMERRNQLNWVTSPYPCTNFPTGRRLNWPFQRAHPFILECAHLPLVEN